MQLYGCVSQQSHMQMIRYIQSLEEDVTIYSNVYFMSFLILKILFSYLKKGILSYFLGICSVRSCTVLRCDLICHFSGTDAAVQPSSGLASQLIDYTVCVCVYYKVTAGSWRTLKNTRESGDKSHCFSFLYIPDSVSDNTDYSGIYRNIFNLVFCSVSFSKLKKCT